MKSTLIVILILALAVVLSQYELSLKDNSLIVRYVQPLFYETLESSMDMVTPSDDSFIAEDQPVEVAQLRQVIDGDTIDVFITCLFYG